MPVSTDQETIGQFFLVHGHQGTKDSDKWAWFSKPFVRYVWQPFQRLTRYRLTTPATDWQMRKAHNVAMYRWAQAQQENLVLITGHTHYPVFASKTHELQLLDEIKMVQAGSGLKGMDKRKKLAELAAKLEWVRAQQSQGQKEAVENEDMKPCYFNTGCCSFSDGDVTGLEIADNEIRLVRWPGEDGAATLKILARASLAGVFARLHPDQAQNEMEGTLAIFEDMLADAMLKSLSTM